MNKAIRVSRDYETIKLWFDTFTYDKLIVYEHPKDEEISRTHCHILVYGLNVKSDNLKYHLKKIDPTLNGRIDWSFSDKEVDDKFITYMSKGKYDPVLVFGYTKPEVDEYTTKWVNPCKMSVENGMLVIDKPVKEVKKKTKRDLIELMKSRYLETMDTEEICKVIRKVLVDNNEVLGMYKVMDYYDALLMYADKHRFIDMVVNKINSRVRV